MKQGKGKSWNGASESGDTVRRADEPRKKHYPPHQPRRLANRISDEILTDLGQRFAPGTHLLASLPGNLDRLLIGFLKDALATLNGISRCQELPISTRQRAAEVVVGATQDLLAAMRTIPTKKGRPTGWNATTPPTPIAQPAVPFPANASSDVAEDEEVPANWWTDGEEDRSREVESEDDDNDTSIEDREMADLSVVRRKCEAAVIRYLEKHGPLSYRDLKNALRTDGWKTLDTPKAVFDDMLKQGTLCRQTGGGGLNGANLFYLPSQDVNPVVGVGSA